MVDFSLTSSISELSVAFLNKNYLSKWLILNVIHAYAMTCYCCYALFIDDTSMDKHLPNGSPKLP